MDVVAALQQKIDLYDSYCYEAIAFGLPVHAIPYPLSSYKSVPGII